MNRVAFVIGPSYRSSAAIEMRILYLWHLAKMSGDCSDTFEGASSGPFDQNLSNLLF
ncbi:MAG: hypothetical protein ACI92Z_001168 [Paracoccaceae bacterium]|jgi:hypothetical protein